MPGICALFAPKGETREPIGACEVYRITQPFSLLEGSYGWKTGWTVLEDIHPSVIFRFVDSSDLIVFPRWYTDPVYLPEISTMLVELRELGKRVVYECDDDYTNLHREVHPYGDSSIRIATLCDAITVSTPPLGRLMREQTGRPVYVLPNSVMKEHWNRFAKAPRHEDDQITLGLSGTRTHYRDWQVLEHVIPRILEDYPQVKLVLGHMHPDYWDDLPDERVIRHPGLPIKDYPWLIQQIDIMLAPVDISDRFNESKSPIKVLEGWAATRPVGKRRGGACVLASNNLIYRPVINHGRDGYLVPHTAADWETALRHVLDRPQERLAVQQRAHRAVKKHFLSNPDNIGRWHKAYKDVLKG